MCDQGSTNEFNVLVIGHITDPASHHHCIVTVLASHWLAILISLLSLIIKQCHQPIMSGHGPINIRILTARQSMISKAENMRYNVGTKYKYQ